MTAVTLRLARPRSWLAAVPGRSAVERRQAYLLEVLLLGAAVAFVIAAASDVFSQPTMGSSVANVLAAALALALVAILRRGRFQVVAALTIALLVVGFAGALVRSDLAGAGSYLALLLVPIVLAGLILPRLSLVATTVGTIAAAAVAVRSRPDADALARTGLGNFLFAALLLAIVVDQFGGTVRDAFVHAVARQDELEAARLEQQRLVSALAEAERIAHVGSWTLDAATGAATWSPEMYRILGLDPSGPAIALGDISRVFTPESVQLVTAAVDRATRSGEPWQLDLEVVRPDGTHAWVASNGVVERDGTGNRRIRGTMQDITEQRRLEDQLRQAQKMEAIGALAGGVAHDFNNLLTAIGGFTRLARRHPDIDPVIAADLDHVAVATDRGTLLVRQLLAFSRQQVLHPVPLDLGETLVEVAPMLRQMLREDIELAIRRDPDVGYVLADPGQLTQVLVNLAVNARDAMPRGGTLTFEVSDTELDADYAHGHTEVVPGPYVVLSATDTGVGMDEQTRQRVFEPFFTTKDAGRGTGLGLATVYGIVRQSGGHIWVYSEPGAGSVFKVYLPRVEATTGERVAAAPVRRRAIGSETILVVEDDEGVRAFVEAVLRDRGYSVLAAIGPDEAIRMTEGPGAAIDLLLTDVVMPRMSGFDLAAAVRRRVPAVRVLYVSGYTAHTVFDGATPDSAGAFLAKPFSPDDLAERVRETLDRPLDSPTAQ